MRRGLLTSQVVEQCSDAYAAVVAAHGGNEAHQRYAGREWKATRSYMDDGKVIDEGLGDIFAPLLRASLNLVQQTLEVPRSSFEPDSCFAHLYDADTPGAESGSSWGWHRDYGNDDTLALASVIIEGFTRDKYLGGGLEVADTSGADRVEEHVLLAPGDALLLRQAWHLPLALRSGKRISFVLFFRKRKPRQQTKGPPRDSALDTGK
eukprot:g5750.t1